MKTKRPPKPVERPCPFTTYQKFKPLARRIAFKFTSSYKLDHRLVMDDAESALALIVCSLNVEGRYFYDPSRSSLMTWLYQHLTWELTTLYTRKKDRARTFSSLRVKSCERDADSDETVSIDSVLPAKTDFLSNFLASISWDARIVVKTLIEAPGDLIHDMNEGAKQRTLSILRRHFEARGWDSDEIDAAFDDIRAMLTGEVTDTFKEGEVDDAFMEVHAELASLLKAKVGATC